MKIKNLRKFFLQPIFILLEVANIINMNGVKVMLTNKETAEMSNQPASYLELKTRQRQQRQHYPESMGLRVHRALSWLNRAEQCDDDLDAAFIFLWIAYNAAYAKELDSRQNKAERALFEQFLKLLCQLDSQQKIYHLIWSEFSGSIRVLLDNKYVFQPFWHYQNQKISRSDWERHFRAAKVAAHTALGKKNTAKILSVVFERLYTLRNQILHGGATWNSQVNRAQLKDAVCLLKKLIPVMIEIMMDHPDSFQDAPCYPVVAAN